MAALDTLARQYDAYIRSDGRGFRRKARVLQSMWREEHNYPIGLHRGRPLGSRLAMPWARQTLNNYLTDTIRAVVRNEVLDKSRSAGKLYARPRIFNDLLSSQPLCFNVFAELQQDREPASAVFRSLTAGRIAEVTGIEFEHSPGRGDARYTGDNSAFDVYVTFRTPEGKGGFAGIEVKYRSFLSDERTFAAWTLEDFLARVRQHTTAGWSTLVFDRYLDFATLGRDERLPAAHPPGPIRPAENRVGGG